MTNLKILTEDKLQNTQKKIKQHKLRIIELEDEDSD